MPVFRQFAFVVLWLSMIASCLGLGVWQIQRLEWKTRWLHNIDEAYRVEPPQPFTNLQIFPEKFDATTFYRGTLTGTIHDAESMLVGPRTHEGQVGWHWYARLRLQRNVNDAVWVNLGFVPVDFKPMQIETHQATVTGTLRLPEFMGSARTDLIKTTDSAGQKNIDWINLHPFREAVLMGVAGGCCRHISPLVLHAEGATHSDPRIVLLKARPFLRNEHLNYAIFWFAMAAIATVIGPIAFWARRLPHQKV